MDELIHTGVFALAAFCIAVATWPLDRRVTLGSAAAFALYLAADDLVTGLPRLLPMLDILPGAWNWDGKLYSLALAAAIILALRLSPAQLGLVWPQARLRLATVVSLAYVAWATWLGHHFGTSYSPETLAFQATMPGLAEELAYRGLAPALLLGLALRGGRADPPHAAVILATALVFGLWHGLAYSQGDISMDWTSAALTGFGGLVAGWLRFATRSLLFPVLVHGVANVAFQLGGSL